MVFSDSFVDVGDLQLVQNVGDDLIQQVGLGGDLQ